MSIEGWIISPGSGGLQVQDQTLRNATPKNSKVTHMQHQLEGLTGVDIALACTLCNALQKSSKILSNITLLRF